jgi:hypothetical protein
MRFVALLSSVLACSALAAPVGLGVGETKHVTVSQRVARVETTDSSRVEVSYKGSIVTMTGKETGRTTLSLVTVDGAEVSLDIHVVTPGARVFTIQKGPPAKQIAKTEQAPRAKPEAHDAPSARPEAHAQNTP